MRVYLLLLTSDRAMGPREVMRALKLSSPSVAYYHLRKLEELEIVKKFDDGYRVVKKVRIRGVVILGKKVVPRMLFFASLFLGILVVEFATLIAKILRGEHASLEYVALIGITLTSSIILAIEGIEMQKKILGS